MYRCPTSPTPLIELYLLKQGLEQWFYETHKLLTG